MKNEVAGTTKLKYKPSKRATKAARRSLSELGAVSWVDVPEAAYRYRETLIARADRVEQGMYPMWYGWAIAEAFEAGVKWERSRTSTAKVSDETPRE